MKAMEKDWYQKNWTLDIQNMSWVEDTNRQVDFLIKQLHLKGTEKILDLACGFGRHSLEFARRGYDVIGIDITPAYIDYANEQAKKENGIIYIDAKEQDGRLTFIVEDSGSGFTKEALLHGTEQFFMDDTSRNGEAHYGMGLFFAKTVAEKYGGGIKLSNSENTGGARVEIFFLSSQETS